MMKAQNVVIFHSKYHPVKKVKEAITTVPYYKELSSSEFDIQSTDEELIKKFQEIKDQIKCNL